KGDLSGWLRREGRLDVIEEMLDWVSPRLGIKFNMLGTELQLYRPDGEKFATYVELATSREQEKLAKEQAQQELEQSQQQLEQSQQQLEQEKVRSQQLAAKLRELGINPD
ncbi:MAG: Uma2 family endonuclease, partial [Tatlockia sp.]|nr:Uma2 family endonuclease [Tatlockia sp.]